MNSERFTPPSLPIEAWNLPRVSESAEESFAVVMSIKFALVFPLFLFRFRFHPPGTVLEMSNPSLGTRVVLSMCGSYFALKSSRTRNRANEQRIGA